MSLSMKVMGQSAINKCLPCFSRAIEEKCLAQSLVYRFENRLICRQLICIEVNVMVICQPQFVIPVIVELFRKERVFIDVVPVILDTWHAREVGKKEPRLDNCLLRRKRP
jgi:hypothetical protein